MKDKLTNMGSRNCSKMDLLELARHLRQEHLFVSSERQQIQMLNDKVLKAVENLFHISWIAKHQRINLNSLILSQSPPHPVSCCHKANALEQVLFIDSYKHLNVHDAVYAEFLQQLREDPKLLATCLVAGEKINLESMQVNVPVIMSAIYGNCILPEDEVFVLKLLRELLLLQLATSDNPRRLLCHGSCSFSQVYKPFSEGLFSAKLFLTASLHDAIMHLLMEDDLFLDIDPGKAVVRFHPTERLRHFGREGTTEYAANLQKYRNRTIGRLVKLTNRFIEGIRSNIYCFPQSLSWLVRQLYGCVMKAKKVEVRQVGAMCADLVFAFFICPAIVNPEPYGITDAPISDIASFNLMQVAQILQVLAMSKWEEINPKLMDLYGKFEKDCMSSILDLILEGSSDESPAAMVSQLCELNRYAVLITESELVGLVSFLSSIQSECQDENLQKALANLLANLPSSAVGKAKQDSNSLNRAISPCQQSENSASHNTSTPNTNSLESAKKNILGKVSRKNLRATLSHLPQLPLSESHENQDNHDDSNTGTSSSSTVPSPLEDVLVIPLSNADFDCPGMLSEDKVLSLELQQKQSRVRMNLDSLVQEEVESITSGPETVEKRTRFSLSQDQESIGASDNLEAISEAASNHSVASSLDLENENENDNLSDMVSANVSGRGTPNVSGRDTPSSQMEGDEQPQRQLDFPVVTRKQNRADIEDKFGKFEIQPMIEGDETKSMVSDTWSTDVLASDSETVEQSDILLQLQNFPPPGLMDTSDVASQSDAWSTDVITSDTERLQELDTDDTASVARSDDTTRSEMEDQAASGIESVRSEPIDFLINVGSSTQAFNLIPNDRRGSQGAEGANPAFDVFSLRGNLLDNSRDALGGRRMSSGLNRDLEIGSAFREVVPGSSHLPDVQVMSSPAKDRSQLKSQQTHQEKKDQTNEQLESKPHFNPLSIDVEHSHSSEMNSSPSMNDDLTPTGNSPNGIASQAHLEPSPLVTNGVINRNNQDTILSMQSLGRLSLAVRELTDSGDQDCAAFLLDTLQENNSSAPISMSGESNGVSTKPRSSIAELLSLDLTKTLNLNEGGQNSDTLKPSVSGNSLLEFEREVLGTVSNATKPDEGNVFEDSVESMVNGTSNLTVTKGDYSSKRNRGRQVNNQEAEHRTRLSSASVSSSSSSCSGSVDAYSRDAGSDVTSDSVTSSLLTDVGGGTPDELGVKLRERREPVDKLIQTSGVSTGAIPKSISFDKTADKSYSREYDDKNGGDQRKSFFKLTNFRFTFKGRNRKPRLGERHSAGDNHSSDVSKNRRHFRHLQPAYSEDANSNNETSDEILAKYRKKPSLGSSSDRSNVSGSVPAKDTTANNIDSLINEEDSQVFEPANGETSFAFNDAKRKLRMVLGSADVQTLPWLTSSGSLSAIASGQNRNTLGLKQRDNDLTAFLKVLLAEAINLQQRPLVAYLHEALRCVRMFDDVGCQKLLKSLKGDYRRRAPYISYLVRCRQGLLSTLAHLEALQVRIQRDKDVCSKYLITLFVRKFLENRERNIELFLKKFQSLTVVDEMAQLVEKFLNFLYNAMEHEPLWQIASQAQFEQAQTVIERTIMSQIYIRALYPNGDGDALRDQVFYQHIQKLSGVITVDHKDLVIPKIYHHECPWPSAQAEIIAINAYKTPRDKIQCILRCCSTIMNLLNMANHKSVPAADDFMPVLVYVLIKANPPSLLSAKEYITIFYEKQLEGEDAYWWTQFVSAIEFIKTMDY